MPCAEQVRFLRRRLQSGWERILNMMNQSAQANRSYVRRLVVTAVLSALSASLMYLEFSVPVVPSFLKYDFSDLPALIAAFGVGPLAGVAVELI